MSLFLLAEDDHSSFLQQSIRPSMKYRKCQPDDNGLKQEDKLIKNQFKKHKNMTFFAFYQSAFCNQYILLLNGISHRFRGILKIKLSKKTKQISMKLDLLNHDDLYYKFNNKYQTIQISRNVCNRINNLQAGLLPIRVSIEIVTGQLSIQLAFLNMFEKSVLCGFSGCSSQNKLFSVFCWLISHHIPILERQIASILGQQRNNSEAKVITKIHRYCDMLIVNSHISDRYPQMAVETRERDKVTALSIEKMITNKVSLEPTLVKNLKLMCVQMHSLCQKDYNLSVQELQFIRSMIAMPVIPRSNNPSQSYSILNQIFIYENSEYDLKKIKEGGFATIYLTKIKFWYRNSYDGYHVINDRERMSKQPKNLLQKSVVVKKEQKYHISKGKWRSRNQHEMSILNEIRKGDSIFLPQYYIVKNRVCPLGQDVIIMDYIPLSNLSEFQQNNHWSLSLLTKLYIMFSMVQAVRYLRDYEIVHLDLKPNNVMIFWNMLVKLIDFGESYHPKVCLTGHRPGFTIPYSSPEIFSDETDCFTSKSDVFSLGVIFYELIYGRYPFDINKNTTLVDSSMQHYLSLWFFVPEQFQNYGDLAILRILNVVVSRCLSKQPECRPQLDWIALIIRHCLQLMS